MKRAGRTGEAETPGEFSLMETRRDVSPVIRTIGGDPTFRKHPISGLPLWERSSDLAVARVGPATLAIGAPGEVDEHVLVRLRMKPDLRRTDQLFTRFHALDS